jgi:SAM-dependent methyltransferase
METTTQEYHNYLEEKYLPGRDIYLKKIFYPKILKEFKKNSTITDLGCGTGGFLSFCKSKGFNSVGIDSNESLVALCRSKGFEVNIDSICELNTIPDHSLENVLSDNVLEHLDGSEIKQVFSKLENKLTQTGVFVCIVPGAKGFKKDPTHKTYVTKALLETMFENTGLKIEKKYFHPFNIFGLHKLFYLNMQVFIIRKE